MKVFRVILLIFAAALIILGIFYIPAADSIEKESPGHLTSFGLSLLGISLGLVSLAIAFIALFIALSSNPPTKVFAGLEFNKRLVSMKNLAAAGSLVGVVEVQGAGMQKTEAFLWDLRAMAQVYKWADKPRLVEARALIENAPLYFEGLVSAATLSEVKKLCRLICGRPKRGGKVMADESKKDKKKINWWKELAPPLLMGAGQLFFGIVLTGMVLYLVAKYKEGDFEPFALATVAGLLGGFPLVTSFGEKVEEGIKKQLRWVGGLYIFSAIFFVVFGFYQAADQACLIPQSGSWVWAFQVIYAVTFYGAAISLIIGMWLTLILLPKLVGLGAVTDRFKRIFRRKDKK